MFRKWLIGVNMKKGEKTEITKERILGLAMQEFGLKGYRGASLNAICEGGISKGLLYHNYKNKDALYLACVQACFLSLTECIRNADIGNDLTKYMEVRMSFFRTHKLEAGIFFDAVLQPPEELYDEISIIKNEFDTINKEIYARILNSLELRQGVTFEEAMAYFYMLQDMIHSSFPKFNTKTLSVAEQMEEYEKMLPKMIDFMLYGIARRDKEC